jgi:hypothetical protein
MLSMMVCGRTEGNDVEGATDGRWGPDVESRSCPAFALCSRSWR